MGNATRYNMLKSMALPLHMLGARRPLCAVARRRLRFGHDFAGFPTAPIVLGGSRVEYSDRLARRNSI